MAGLDIKSLGSPDEVRPFADDKGAAHLVNLPSGPVGHGVFEPGWRWSEHVKPIAGTDSCQTAHRNQNRDTASTVGRLFAGVADGQVW